MAGTSPAMTNKNRFARHPPPAGEGLEILPPHPLEHALDMGDRRVGQDAVAEIEDERPARKSVQHVVDFPIERAAACAQEQRIDIALHRHPALDLLAGEASVNA